MTSATALLLSLVADLKHCYRLYLTAWSPPLSVSDCVTGMFTASLQQKLDVLQKELADVQLKYQRELERVERDNKELRKRLLLRANETAAHRKIKVG